MDAIENDSDSATEDTAHQETNATSHHDTPDSPSVSKHPTPCGIPMNDILEAINTCDDLFAEWENDAIIVTHTLTQPAYQTVIAVREPTFEDLLSDELQAVITVTTATDKVLEAIDAETLNRYAVGSAYSSPGIGARCFGSRFTVPKSALEENGGAVWRDVLIPLMVGATRYALAPLIALLTNPGALKHDSEEDTSATWTERDFNRLRDTWSMIFTLCTTGETGLTGEFELVDGNTALWQIRKETHPVAGPGLVITLTLPKHYETESACADQADLLNELEMIIGTPAPHFGAWTEKRRFLTYVCFLPNTMYRCQSLFINLPIYAMVRARWAYIESRRLDWVE